MGFSGVRIAIFTSDDKTPNLAMFDALYDEAKSREFDIFANPAQHAGGQRIANGDNADLGNVGPSPLNNDGATQALIERVLEFAEKYKCKWINPFIEDGPANREWSSDQIYTVCSSLEGNLNGADLIGPGGWGITDSISVLSNTNIGNIIKIATTHNLGFHHNLWPDFFDLAGEYGLDVWDSEANLASKNPGEINRLESALQAGVDGLVIYHAWTYISLTDGSINDAGLGIRSLILKSANTDDDNDGNDDGNDEDDDGDRDDDGNKDDDDDDDDEEPEPSPSPSAPEPSPSGPESEPEPSSGSGSSPSD